MQSHVVLPILAALMKLVALLLPVFAVLVIVYNALLSGSGVIRLDLWGLLCTGGMIFAGILLYAFAKIIDLLLRLDDNLYKLLVLVHRQQRTPTDGQG